MKSVKRYSISNRTSKVLVSDFIGDLKNDDTVKSFISKLPNILTGADFKEVVERIKKANNQRKMIIWGIGGHVIKVGLNPLLIKLANRKFLTALAMNGSCIVHDIETAFFGKTSEDVESSLTKGEFGMAKETTSMINEALEKGVSKGLGIGGSISLFMHKEKPKYREKSLFYMMREYDIPVTVSMAIGTDIYHMDESIDGAILGKGGMHDFRMFCKLIEKLDDGVYLNVGSAVILPEVFLKAISLAINRKQLSRGFTTVNFDFIKHYRSYNNVVVRPSKIAKAKGFNFIGHHEIMIPLLGSALI